MMPKNAGLGQYLYCKVGFLVFFIWAWLFREMPSSWKCTDLIVTTYLAINPSCLPPLSRFFSPIQLSITRPPCEIYRDAYPPCPPLTSSQPPLQLFTSLPTPTTSNPRSPSTSVIHPLALSESSSPSFASLLTAKTTRTLS